MGGQGAEMVVWAGTGGWGGGGEKERIHGI